MTWFARPLEDLDLSKITRIIPQVSSEKIKNKDSESNECSINIKDIPQVANDSATAFANGDYEKAQSILITHLNEAHGNTSKLVWHLLFDLYQVRKNKNQFEKLAFLFAKKFDVSPPSWVDLSIENESLFSGRNIMILEGDLDKSIYEKSKDFLRVAKRQKNCKFECSKVDISSSTEDGLKIWLETMRSARSLKVNSVLMGETGIMENLKKLISEDETKENQIFWLLLLELMQWRGKESEFEELAFLFAKEFNISPPGYEKTEAMSLFKAENKATLRKIATPPSILTAGVMNDWIKVLSIWIKNNPEKQADINFQNVERMSFDATNILSQWSDNNPTMVTNIRIIQPNQLILILMVMMGITNSIKIVNKKI